MRRWKPLQDSTAGIWTSKPEASRHRGVLQAALRGYFLPELIALPAMTERWARQADLGG